MTMSTAEQVGVTSKRGEPPKHGTQKLLAHRDIALMIAFNQNVLAIRELQSIILELLERVDELEKTR